MCASLALESDVMSDVRFETPGDERAVLEHFMNTKDVIDQRKS